MAPLSIPSEVSNLPRTSLRMMPLLSRDSQSGLPARTIGLMVFALVFFFIIFAVFTPTPRCCTRRRVRVNAGSTVNGNRREREGAAAAAAGGRAMGMDGQGRRQAGASEDGDIELPAYEPSPVIPPPAYCAK